ncbi:hypothetical protein E2320_019518 [Naja naja]|nr:hypothetical protein E2320_019518 [Naja naja]
MDAANLSDIPPNRKKAYFLGFCGATIFETATALLAPQMVKAVTWEELQEVLDQLDDMLLDQLVCRVRDLQLQRRLLVKADLNLKQAIEEAQAAKLSNLSAAKIQKASSLPGGKPSSAVHYEDTYFKDEDFEEEEEINCLKHLSPYREGVFPSIEDN